MAARLLGMKVVIVVPNGNSPEKNRAMQAQGAELVEHGHDFQEALEFADSLARERGYAKFESFHEQLVRGAATFALELFQSAPKLDVVYVPIGMGSSICGVVAARNALNLSTEIIGVTAVANAATANSFRQRKLIEAPANSEIADGLACRRPNQDALDITLPKCRASLKSLNPRSPTRCLSITRTRTTLPKAPEPLPSRPRSSRNHLSWANVPASFSREEMSTANCMSPRSPVHSKPARPKPVRFRIVHSNRERFRQRGRRDRAPRKPHSPRPFG